MCLKRAKKKKLNFERPINLKKSVAVLLCLFRDGYRKEMNFMKSFYEKKKKFLKGIHKILNIKT